MNQDLEEMSAKNSASIESAISLEALQQQVNQLSNERDQLKSGNCLLRKVGFLNLKINPIILK